MGSVFSFKGFQVDQANCAMKINTDGVLLGVMAKCIAPLRILDIGTGTGVIALMLAQRFADAQVEALEIDVQAAERAAQNFQESPFADRVRLVGQDFNNAVPQPAYDLIVTNPPFYTDSLPNPDERRRLAKHTDLVFFENLLSFVQRNLSQRGTFQLIVPPALAELISSTILPELNLHVVEELAISSFAGSPVIRQIMYISRENATKLTSNFYIYDTKGVYSEAYKSHLKPFFLAY